ncbi:hypothetical protein pb186bvf_003510 [Paramecium bursaria]
MFKPSQFRIQSLGHCAYDPNYNPRFNYMGSEDYFQDEEDLQQSKLEEQMLQAIQQQNLSMSQKEILTFALFQQNNYKKKKVFDSADYYMKHQPVKTIEQQQEDALLLRYAVQDLSYKAPLTKKQKKQFDSADYFLSLYKA